MKVVITGATGNIGTSVIKRLAEDEAVTEIVGIARRPTSWSPPKTRWVSADVATDDLTQVFRGADAVVHLAWIFQPTHRPLATWKNNVLGSIKVFEAAAAAGAGALIHASSIAAYSGRRGDERVAESWPTHSLPTAAYGREKAYLERVLDVVERDHPGMRVVRMRTAFIFQRASAQEQRRLFLGPLVPASLLRPGMIPLVPDMPGLQLQALHASDAAEAYRLAVVNDVRGAFNIAAEPVLDAEALAHLLGARIVKIPTWAPRAALSAAWRLRAVPVPPELFDLALLMPVLDTTRARTELGWEPQIDALDAVREVLEGMQEGAGGDTPPLAAKAGGPLRSREVATGIGGVGGVEPDGR